ncbi:imidazoleglycerol-phosphate dehydratase HisB [Acidipropionibacterium jensenii]|uniref:Imidazoleglycerol-phosphate dehydratase n=2 Tax=Acidipropionibacterium jensenii TaxID=1749 RepID=A0A3Q9UFF7_9ACTN|nr:imidazoleglycerol-phosphate dehydratase HisB [Acidipropionibacterium jensenii]AZZ40761.1 imidazoleglycerol-phosphate dehydratase HisB [Acidipropionibacterium jensenii]MDN5977000.1 imidazoleglycerol-phosphate dehydratase HisB [Acidipropionibacterium jensenii]MDN5995924.1 imidazoleglycerol-phosphate dehydratase HisB [Acidipropionibacterium jensenii]MDN6427847.1 imidazoleglycerol-phosphate dehydratase HisB [Acidipropionibacterium jensenii]MDN6442810.1 imidazoleglycerol-phosphate dehydratase Hi
MMSRTAHVVRNTSESQVDVSIDLDGTGESTISTGVGFYDHMLTALSKHSGIDMRIRTTGDLEIDGHHSIEDTAIALGQAIGEALGDKAGITRFGDATVPLDEALAQCVVDVAGRPYVVCSGEPESQVTVRIGGSGVAYQGSMTYHVVESLATNAGLCVHLRLLAGRDPHHICEAQYKALARALRIALAPDPRMAGRIPSTKGTLNA